MTMHNFLNNRLAATVITLMFLAASGASMLSGSTTAFGTDRLLLPDVVTTAHGPTMPPDPWEGTGSNLVAHGPTMPPDPWEGTGSNLIAHGPTMPPDPWEGTGSNLIAHGPTMPARSVGGHRLQPDRARPHDSARSVGGHRLQPVAHGPTMPPDPWEGTGSNLVAHGPTMPPDPWEGTGSNLIAHGPTHAARSVGRHWLELHCSDRELSPGVTTSESLVLRPRIGVHAISFASGCLDDRSSPGTPRSSLRCCRDTTADIPFSSFTASVIS